MLYHNYHKHDHKGNPWSSADTVAKPIDYCKRAVELGHNTVFTTNHGVVGDVFEWMDEAKKHNLKLVFGTEAYYVPSYKELDDGKKDRSNRHVIVIAKNNDGAKEINKAMSVAHDDGFYYRPRINYDMIMGFTPGNVIITTACVAGIWNDSELIMKLQRRYGKDFFLELQPHNIEVQKETNKYLIELHNASGIPIIHANDSHYVYPDEAEYRDIFLRAKNHFYDYEEGMILDYPSSDDVFKRYKQQGVLSEKEVQEALENTLVFDSCEEYSLINDDIKLPEISKTPTEDLKIIINSRWLEERDDIDKEMHPVYLDAIRTEMDTIEKTKMENYFLIDYNIAKVAQEKYGGKLTNTGRGSAPSFYTTKLLGLTDIDRVSAPVTLFPSRFMSVERILGARSLPDIDLNTADREPFIKATEDLLGKENCAWMLAWKPMQHSTAFRTYCKGIGMDISEYDEIAKNLDVYENDKKWSSLIKNSKKFVGVVESVSESPCSMLLYDKPVNEELGLVRTPKGKMCCLLDGYNCDKYKYLKNDYLSVIVWAIIKDTCELAGIPIPTIKELDRLLDEKTFDIYKNGLTCTINQADSDFGTSVVMEYQPKSVAEMSAFVAIIRPGCASLLRDFIQRKPYSTGVSELDSQLEEADHRMIYQELIMKYLIWLGIPETGSYDIIKKIAKKKFSADEQEKLKAELKKGWVNNVGSEDGFEKTWTVVEQASRYSFNASHSLSYGYDSLYGAYLKSHYPLEYYTVALNYYTDDVPRTTKLTKELSFFNIKLKPIKFRYSRSMYSLLRDDNSIYKGIASIKHMNSKIADEMYELRNNKYNSFMELLFDLKDKTTLQEDQKIILIELDFFSEFGDANHLIAQNEMFNNFGGRVQLNKEKIISFKIPFDFVEIYSGKETEKMFTKVNTKQMLIDMSDNITYQPRKLSDKINAMIKHLGYVDISDDRYAGLAAVMSVNTKFSPRVKLHSLKNGNVIDCKINKKTFNSNQFKEGDIIRINKTIKKLKSMKDENGNWVKVEGTTELWIDRYEKVKNL